MPEKKMKNIKRELIEQKLNLVVEKLMNLGGPENEAELKDGGEAIGFFKRDFGIAEWDWPQGVGLYGLLKMMKIQGNDDYKTFVEALKFVNVSLAKKMARDGEGATKLIECKIIGAKDEETGVILAKSVIKSSLVKTAVFGSDANWGRILCALGYAGPDFDPEKVNVYFESNKGSILVCKDGSSVPFDEDKAKEILLEEEILIKIELNQGDYTVSAYGCDLTYDYIKINGDYRS